MMYHRTVQISVILCLFLGFMNINAQTKNYELVELEDGNGIMVEKFDSTFKNPEKYNLDNKTFKVGTTFTYEFEHQTQEGNKQFYNVKGKNNQEWYFVDPEEADSNTTKRVEISVIRGNPFAKFMPDYNQTALFYKTAGGKVISASGAIENEANIWIHPPRDNYFKILELNPFPYIKAPYKAGTEWTWKLGIGSQWGDKRWKTWEGGIVNSYQYKIVKQTKIKTPLGNLKCWVVEGNAKSKLGETKLTSYYHPKYGFVKLDYTNIDGSKTILNLVEYKFQKIKMKAEIN